MPDRFIVPTWRDAGSLFDIVDSARRILAYVEGLSEEDFRSNLFVQDAVIRRFLIIGEATKRLSAETRAAHPEVPWKELTGFRDVAVHNYAGIEPGRVWAAIHDELPGFIGVLEPLIPPVENE